jgi:hypothetical protein
MDALNQGAKARCVYWLASLLIWVGDAASWPTASWRAIATLEAVRALASHCLQRLRYLLSGTQRHTAASIVTTTIIAVAPGFSCSPSNTALTTATITCDQQCANEKAADVHGDWVHGVPIGSRLGIGEVSQRWSHLPVMPWQGIQETRG